MSARLPPVGAASAVPAGDGWRYWSLPCSEWFRPIAAHVGSVTHNDLQTLTLKRFGRRVAAALLVSVVIVNAVTIAADLQAGAAGIGLLADVDSRWLVVHWGWLLSDCYWSASTDKLWACCAACSLAFWLSGSPHSSRIPTGPGSSGPVWFPRCRSVPT